MSPGLWCELAPLGVLAVVGAAWPDRSRELALLGGALWLVGVRLASCAYRHSPAVRDAYGTSAGTRPAVRAVILGLLVLMGLSDPPVRALAEAPPAAELQDPLTAPGERPPFTVIGTESR